MGSIKTTAVAVFEDKQIRRVLIENEWWFSVVDIVAVLTDSENARDYWYKMKIRENDEAGVQLSTICRQLKLIAPDGRSRETDCANTEGMFRIIQSIPSPKAEPFKRWLAQVGYDRVKEIEDPELAQERARELYEKKGYSLSWIEKRLRGIAVRQDLTNEWKNKGLTTQDEFAILTAEISKASFGMTPAEYKKLKGLTKENLRDHMTGLELIFSMLGEASTAEIERARDLKTMAEHKKASNDGGSVARKARVDLEKKSGRKVIAQENYLEIPEKEKRLESKG